MANHEQHEEGFQPDLDMSSIALAGFFGALVTFVLIVLLQVVYYSFAANVARAGAMNDPNTDYLNLSAKQRESLNVADYAWVDKAKGTVRIPLNRAIELTLAEANAKKGEFHAVDIPAAPPAPPAGDATPPSAAKPDTVPAPAPNTPPANPSSPAPSPPTTPAAPAPASEQPAPAPMTPAPATPAPAAPAPAAGAAANS